MSGFIPDALIVGTVFVNAVANALTTRASVATLHLTPKNGAEFRGEVLGGYPVTETSWGRVVRVTEDRWRLPSVSTSRCGTTESLKP